MVLVFAESQNGNFKKGAFEAVTYAAKAAKLMGTECAVLTLGEAKDAGQLGKYGASKVINVTGEGLKQLDSQVSTAAIAGVANQIGADLIILSHSSTGKTIHGRLAAKLGAGSVTGVNALPDVSNGFRVKKNVFSGKAIAEFEIKTAQKVLTLMGNSLQPEELGAAVEVESMSVELPAPRVTIKEVSRIEGTVPLPEAELVVSAGRGLKGPENWGIVEELATTIGATTACSRPVADADWRPHHEHVGQTGVAIRPNLYIAIGISGAIQHLAGVNRSKVIVVVNKDPEAPFFKAADYGICADLFDVIPRLTEAVKKFKNQN
ncbi:MAG: electron transfer flavoprotein subunit alpha/FixB family protein [Bacteroidota bacterium]